MSVAEKEMNRLIEDNKNQLINEANEIRRYAILLADFVKEYGYLPLWYTDFQSQMRKMDAITAQANILAAMKWSVDRGGDG